MPYVDDCSAIAELGGMTRLSRCAPAVSYPAGRSLALGFVLLGLWLAGVFVLAAWHLLGAKSSWVAVTLSGGLWLAATGGALHFWLRQFVGAMRWDGQAWTLEHQSRESDFWVLSGAPEVLLDLQTHLWVHVSPSGHNRLWLWLERSSQPERWMGLRRAVYSRATSGADNADETAPANRRGA